MSNEVTSVNFHMRDDTRLTGYVRKADDLGDSWVGMYFGGQQVTLFPKGARGRDQLGNMLVQLGSALILNDEIEWEDR